MSALPQYVSYFTLHMYLLEAPIEGHTQRSSAFLKCGCLSLAGCVAVILNLLIGEDVDKSLPSYRGLYVLP